MLGSEHIRFAIVGCGNIGGLHAEVISSLPEAQLVAVCDSRPESAKRLAERYGVKWYTDYQDMICRNDVDVVNICTPSGAHLEPAVAAAVAGKHVICEKPLEVTVERADRIISACDASGVHLAAILPLRFTPAARLAHQAIQQGRLGRPVLGEVSLKWWRTQEYYDAGGWRGTWALDGGGALMNQAIHRVDLLQWLLGPVESVCAATGILAHERIEVEDLAVGIARLRTGALGSLVASTATQPGFPSRVVLHGTRGTIELEEHRITTWKLADGSAEEEAEVLARFRPDGLGGSSDPMNISNEGHTRQIADMIRAIHEEREPEVDGREGRRAVAAVCALYESARNGRWVEVPDDRTEHTH